jgi:hypothetical protein
MRFGGKENVGLGQMNRRLISTASGGFNPDIFDSDSFNPLYTHAHAHDHAHAHAFSYGARQIFQDDLKPGFANFSGDFKPLLMTDPFRRMNEPNELPNIPGSSMADNIRYGM